MIINCFSKVCRLVPLPKLPTAREKASLGTMAFQRTLSLTEEFSLLHQIGMLDEGISMLTVCERGEGHDKTVLIYTFMQPVMKLFIRPHTGPNCWLER